MQQELLQGKVWRTENWDRGGTWGSGGGVWGKRVKGWGRGGVPNGLLWRDHYFSHFASTGGGEHHAPARDGSWTPMKPDVWDRDSTHSISSVFYRGGYNRGHSISSVFLQRWVYSTHTIILTFTEVGRTPSKEWILFTPMPKARINTRNLQPPCGLLLTWKR